MDSRSACHRVRASAGSVAQATAFSVVTTVSPFAARKPAYWPSSFSCRSILNPIARRTARYSSSLPCRLLMPRHQARGARGRAACRSRPWRRWRWSGRPAVAQDLADVLQRGAGRGACPRRRYGAGGARRRFPRPQRCEARAAICVTAPRVSGRCGARTPANTSRPLGPGRAGRRADRPPGPRRRRAAGAGARAGFPLPRTVISPARQSMSSSRSPAASLGPQPHAGEQQQDGPVTAPGDGGQVA